MVCFIFDENANHWCVIGFSWGGGLYANFTLSIKIYILSGSSHNQLLNQCIAFFLFESVASVLLHPELQLFHKSDARS